MTIAPPNAVATPDYAAIKQKQQTTWAAGNYGIEVDLELLQRVGEIAV
jgi:hypothetical protein